MPHNLKVIISGGGTGGHLYPAIAIGEALRSHGDEPYDKGKGKGKPTEDLPASAPKEALLERIEILQ